MPNENEAAKFLQVFFDSHGEEDINIANLGNEEKQLMLRIRQEIVNVNPFISHGNKPCIHVLEVLLFCYVFSCSIFFTMKINI